MNAQLFHRKNFIIIFLLILSAMFRVTAAAQKVPVTASATDTIGASPALSLPAPYATSSARKISKVIGWTDDKKPVAPDGFMVSKFADSLDNPRWIYTAPNGDIFVAMANTVSDGFAKPNSGKETKTSSNTILLFRDANGDGIAEVKKVFLSGLNRPFGMLVLKNKFYVANTDALLQYDYTEGQTEISGKGTKILSLPAGGYNNHWTRNLLAAKDGSKIYITVGSGSNVGENGMDNEKRRADILEINPDGTGEKIYASGLRNPVGMGWASGTNTLWTAVNERDGLGDDLVPDYATSVQQGSFYGWPYAYFGANEDPRLAGKRPDLVAKTLVPDVPLGAHTASLGLVFNEKNFLTNSYFGGMFIGQHGSWNRSEFAGYKVVFVPFKNGKPSGAVQDFLTGFVADKQTSTVYGRPVGVAFSRDGALLVADDAGKTIWRVSKK